MPASTDVARFAVEFGPVLGLDISTNALGLAPDVGLEVGGRLALGPGAFAFAVRGTWQRYNMAQSATAPCTRAMTDGAPSSPCVSMPATGAYDYTLSEDVVRINLALSYRFLPLERPFNVYLGVAPGVALQRAETTAWNLLTTETATSWGVGGFVGAMYRLGPGALWLEAGYAFAPVNHKVTGDASVSTVTAALGYRVAL